MSSVRATLPGHAKPCPSAAAGLFGVHGPYAVSGVDRDRLARSDTDADATGTAYSDHTNASYRACVDPRGYYANEGTNPQPDSGRLT